MKNLSLLFSVILLTNLLQAQYQYSTKDKKALQFFEQAGMQMRQGQFEAAQSSYEQAIARDSGFVEAYYEFGILLAELKKKEQAISMLQRAKSLSGEKFPELDYYIGGLYLETAHYDAALKSLETFISSESADLKRRDMAERMIQQCKFALRHKDDVSDIKPVNLGPSINSKFDEYYPCLTADDGVILYTRNLPSTQSISGQNEDFFMAVNRGGQWMASQNMGPPINSMNNEGAPSLSVDGQLLIFTACPLYGDYGPGRKGFGSCDLFFSQKSGNSWSAPRNLGPVVNTSAWETQPSFSSDGKTLYFIRGKQQGGNKMGDIYRTQVSDSGWSEPERLSDVVNTEGSEESVLIHPDGKTLYFSSNGHPGFGGLDLFKSTMDEEGNWSKPENLGRPINSAGDENSLLVNARGDIGYFGSDRPGGLGGLDLYSFELPEDKRPGKVTYMKGRVYDATNNKPLSAYFELINLKTEKVVVRTYTDKVTGEYLLCLPPNNDYALNCSAKGYLFHSENFTLTVKENSDKPYEKDVAMVPIKEGARAVLNNIFFETAKFNLKPESKVELDKLANFIQINANIKIEIGGHTDNTGTKEINVTLSKNRAKAVYDYLIEKGIAADRLSYQGYADTEPVASNDTESGRSKNRRTEFKITSIQP